jgi:hypothetical protein
LLLAFKAKTLNQQNFIVALYRKDAFKDKMDAVPDHTDALLIIKKTCKVLLRTFLTDEVHSNMQLDQKMTYHQAEERHKIVQQKLSTSTREKTSLMVAIFYIQETYNHLSAF